MVIPLAYGGCRANLSERANLRTKVVTGPTQGRSWLSRYEGGYGMLPDRVPSENQTLVLQGVEGRGDDSGSACSLQKLAVILHESAVMNLGVRSLFNRQGFSLAELVVVMAVFGLTSAAVLPSFVGYLRAVTAGAGAREVSAALARARELAITSNQFVCVQVVSNRLRFRTGASQATVCGNGATWTGSTTNAQGQIALSGNHGLTSSQDLVFNSFGGTTATSTFTVGDSASGYRTVTVTTTGRINAGN